MEQKTKKMFLLVLLCANVSCENGFLNDDGSRCGLSKSKYIKTIRDIKTQPGGFYTIFPSDFPNGLILCPSQEEKFKNYDFTSGYIITARVYECSSCTYQTSPILYHYITKIKKI